jgi:O-antigen ligase
MQTKLNNWVTEELVQPLQGLLPALKQSIDELIKLPLIYKWTTLLVVIYMALPPLMYNSDPVEFHLIKLNTMYITIVLLVLTVLFGYNHFPYLATSWKTFKYERYAIFLAVFFMLFSLAINYPQMNLFVRAEIISTPVFYGAGPNFISIFYYWLAFLVLFVGPIVYPHLPKRLVQYVIYLSLFITGALIAYQVLVDDFMGVSRAYLFGFGNSNYTPDAFAIFGLFLMIPLLYEKRIKVFSTLLGIFFFVVVLLSVSRASWVGVGVAGLGSIGYLLYRKELELQRFLVLVGMGLTTLVALVLVLIGLGESIVLDNFTSLLSVFSSDGDLSVVSSLRTPLWGSAIQMWLYGLADGTEVFRLNFASIIFGNGQSVYLWLDEGTQYLVTNVHQMYLDVLMSGGIVVFASFIFLLVQQFRYVFQLMKLDIKYVTLFAGLLFIMGKWFFNSLNGLHAPFVLIVFILITYHYMMNAKEFEKRSR